MAAIVSTYMYMFVILCISAGVGLPVINGSVVSCLLEQWILGRNLILIHMYAAYCIVLGLYIYMVNIFIVNKTLLSQFISGNSPTKII